MKILFYKTSSGRCPVEKSIAEFSKADQAKFSDVYDGITEHGLEYERVEFRQLDGKLWEIKFKGHDGAYRIAYVLAEHDQMVWLHVFRKSSQKTKRNDLELAKKRMLEVLS